MPKEMTNSKQSLSVEDAAENAVRELDALGRALTFLGRIDITAAIERDISGPLRASLRSRSPLKDNSNG